MLQVNDEGLNLIKKSENDNDPKSGYRTRSILKDGRMATEVYFVPYVDAVGVCTIGFGTIVYENGSRVSMKDPEISPERACELLRWELMEKCESIRSFLSRYNISLNDNQFSALVSLAYNCGVGAITAMDSSMRSALIKRDPEATRRAFRLWVKGTKKIFGIPVKVTLSGLVIRREREISLFFKEQLAHEKAGS